MVILGSTPGDRSAACMIARAQKQISDFSVHSLVKYSAFVVQLLTFRLRATSCFSENATCSHLRHIGFLPVHYTSLLTDASSLHEQYSLLQTVVEACQKKRQCKFQPTGRPYGTDPCPGTPKYVHVDYKCRPYEFRSKVACQSETVHLQCNPNARIAVYSASFGRTEYESIQCPQPQGVPEETCLVSYATEIVMRMCHGKRRCTLPADSETFGKPCRSDSRMYLKVVYTCVPRKVLMEAIEEAAQADEVADDHEDDLDAYDTADETGAFSPSPNVQGAGPGLNDRGTGGAAPARDPTTLSPHAPVHDGNINHSDIQKYGPYVKPHITSKKFSHSPSAPVDPITTKDMQGDDVSDEKVLENNNCNITVNLEDKTNVIGFISEWINAYNFISRNQEKFYLYLILSVTAGLVLFLGLVIGRLLLQRRRSQRNPKPSAPPTEQTLPNGFTDDLSEAEMETAVSGSDTVLGLVPTKAPNVPGRTPPTSVSEVVRFGGSSGIPRSLNRATNSQYYYG
ncbi:protein eva-1 [Schistocerca americana]|uniref:protein eva-1 n=1 Tax=Schistocerca americana TaxID=7009 RepID=UPI001F4F4432|nr:protein eva-1 [Schistocerca americana]